MDHLSSTIQLALLRFLCVLLAIVLLVMLSVTLYFRNMLNRIDYLPSQEVPALSQQPEGIQEAFSPGDTTIGGEGSGIVNILLIGQDRREADEASRSDSMILCTFCPETKSITMTSFLRDLYVQIPGYESNRLNAAYAMGGTPLLKQTLEDNFGLHIDGSVEVDFSQFSQVIDLLGGVSLEIRQDEAEAINAAVPGALTGGTQWLSGSQALAYARIRNLDGDGDFSRTNRQRKVITALVRSYKDANIKSVITMLTQAMPMISTDLSRQQLLRYAVTLFPLLADGSITSQRIPADGTYEDRMVQGMAVLSADMDAARALLEQTLLESH